MLQKCLCCVNACLLLQPTRLVLRQRIFEMDNNSIKQIVNHIPLFKYRYTGSFSSDFVPDLPINTFAIINTQTSNTPGEHWRMIAKFHHELYFTDFLGLSINNYCFLEQFYSQMFRTRLQDLPSVCGFYTILCNISFVQVSTRGDDWCSWCYCILFFINNFM